MLNNHILRKIIEHLRKPFIQRLIILVLSTLLATSLSCAAIVMQPESGYEVALSQPVIVNPGREAFALNMHVERRATGQATTQRTGGQFTKRRRS